MRERAEGREGGWGRCRRFSYSLLQLHPYREVRGNKRTERVASTADITFGQQLGKAETLRRLRNFLNMYRLECHSIDSLKDRELEKGSSRRSIL